MLMGTARCAFIQTVQFALRQKHEGSRDIAEELEDMHKLSPRVNHGGPIRTFGIPCREMIVKTGLKGLIDVDSPIFHEKIKRTDTGNSKMMDSMR